MSQEDRLRLTMWVDANAPYHDQFVNKRPADPAYDLAADKTLRQQLSQIHERRCISCHQPDEITRLDWIDLNNPGKSLFLTAPLAGSGGARKTCSQPTYADTQDADFVLAHDLLRAAVTRAWENPRRDLTAIRRPREVALGNP
jgi:hypothetical protein